MTDQSQREGPPMHERVALVVLTLTFSAIVVGEQLTPAPDVQTIAVQVVALRQLIDERDRLYTERDKAAKVAVDAALVASTKGIETALAASTKALEAALAANRVAVDAAFSANKELTAQAFAAAKEAVAKAETAQAAYNARSNEFRQSLDDAAKLMLTRTEADTRFKNIEKEVTELRAWQSTAQGSVLTTKESQAQSNWTSDSRLSIIAILTAIAGTIITLFIAFRQTRRQDAVAQPIYISPPAAAQVTPK